MKSITIERTYEASVADIWALWTTKDGFESWWGPEGFRVDVHSLDAHGRFTELRPGERLVLTHIIDFLPGVIPYESTIVAEFFPAGDRVRMVVTLHPMHDEAFSRMQVEGFTSQLTKLDRRFGA